MEVGLHHLMFEANVTKLLTPEFWQEAATQVFNSDGIGFGSLITLASYSKFKNNCCRDAIIITFVDCATSIVAGIAIFSILGFIATQQGVKIDAVVQSDEYNELWNKTDREKNVIWMASNQTNRESDEVEW